MMENKAALRRHVRQALAEMDTDMLAEADREIVRRVTMLPEYVKAEKIFAYYSVGRELSTHLLLCDALMRGKTLALPVCLPGGKMWAAVITDLDQLTDCYYGIPQPGPDCPELPGREMELVLVPGLCYDRSGFRLGQGGGYYDRFLPGVSGVKLGLCRHAFFYDVLPRETHDIPVSCVVTEKEIARPV